MSYMNQTSGPRRQRGAALVVGLLLLTVITLLAIAGMNSASVELVMAGNSQFHQKAFQAAETGIETTLVTGGFLPGTDDPPNNDVPVTGSDPDKYSVELRSDLKGLPQPAIWGNSASAFSTYHFQISSIGQSARSSKTTHLQGVAVLAPSSPVFTGPGKFN